MLDWPSPAVAGQTYSSPDGSTEWVYDGAKWTGAGVGAALSFGAINVKNFGAKGDGVTDDTAALQAAADAASGGTLVFPLGVYAVKTGPLISSNTLVDGGGATILGIAPFNTGHPLLSNKNNNWQAGVTTLTDHDITIRNLTLDYGSSGQGGGAHCIHFDFVRNVSVVNCTMQCRGAGNATSMIACYNTVIDGCTAYGFTNCSYDHWWNPRKGRVVNSYAETASSVQMVNWNPEPSGTPTGPFAANEFVLANCQFYATGAPAIPCQIEPLGAGNSVQDVIISDNTFVNVFLSLRGAVTGATVSGNVFDSVAGGNEVIRSYTYNGGSPTAIAVIGNTIINPGTVGGSVAVIRVYTNSATIANNVIIGGTVTSIDTSTFSPALIGNSVSAGGITGAYTTQSGGIAFGSVAASSGTDVSKHIRLYGTARGINAGANDINYVVDGGGSHVFWTASGTLAGLINSTMGAFNTVMTGGTSGPTWTMGAGAPSATAPRGSIYSRIGGAVGATLYVSQGGGTWNAVAGV